MNWRVPSAECRVESGECRVDLAAPAPDIPERHGGVIATGGESPGVQEPAGRGGVGFQ